MKIAIAFLACVGLVVATSLHKTHEVKIADKDFLAKQKFLFEIVYRVEDPLMFDEYIKMGKAFTFEKSSFSVSITGQRHLNKATQTESISQSSLAGMGHLHGEVLRGFQNALPAAQG